MITCPKCTKEIADDSAHCGYCGQEIKAKNEKKTMFGMAALDGAMLEKAVQEAQAAKDQAKKAEGGLKLPKPSGGLGSGSTPSPSASGGSAGLKLPRPGQSADEVEDVGLAKTEMLEFNEEARADLRKASEAAAAAESHVQGAVDDLGDTAAFDSDDVNAQTAPTALPNFDEPAGGVAFGQQDGFGQQGGFGQQEVTPQGGFGQQGPVPAPEGGFGQQAGFDQPPSAAPQDGFPQPQGGDLPAHAPEQAPKSKKGLFIIIGVVVLLGTLGCLMGGVYLLMSNLAG